MSRILLWALLAGIPTATMVGCSTAPKTAEERTDLMDASRKAISQAEDRDSTLKPVLLDSVGYAVFPNMGKGGFIIGGGYGQGVLYEHGTAVGYCSQTQTSAGAEIGGQTYSQIIVFNTPEALQAFKEGKTVFGAEATAIAANEGAASKAMFHNGVAVFTHAESGLQAQASMTGQSFSYEPLSPEATVQPAAAKMTPADEEQTVPTIGEK